MRYKTRNIETLDTKMPLKQYMEAEPVRITCDQCAFASINGVGCHETGCPNSGARFDVESGDWIKQRKCFECGYMVDKDEPCCVDIDEDVDNAQQIDIESEVS
jgi:hypothetical protein